MRLPTRTAVVAAPRPRVRQMRIVSGCETSLCNECREAVETEVVQVALHSALAEAEVAPADLAAEDGPALVAGAETSLAADGVEDGSVLPKLRLPKRHMNAAWFVSTNR